MESFYSLDIVNQAITNLFVGIAFALINVVVRYFAPMVPYVITVLTWKRIKTALIAAYMIALILQVVTSPYFRSAFVSTYVEFAWSPYQALFNVLGVIVVDLVVLAVRGARRGAEIGGQQLAAAKNRAADELGELGEKVSGVLARDDKETHAARRAAEEAAQAQAAAERQGRIDERLKDY